MKDRSNPRGFEGVSREVPMRQQRASDTPNAHPPVSSQSPNPAPLERSLTTFIPAPAIDAFPFRKA